MNKPDMKDAPQWASWGAMDEDGELWWYENKPRKSFNTWWPTGGVAKRADVPVIDGWESAGWESSLTRVEDRS